MTAPDAPAGPAGMSGPELRALASEALGRGWQGSLARSLGVSPVTVSRWANGHQPISPAMAVAILCVCSHDLAEIPEPL